VPRYAGSVLVRLVTATDRLVTLYTRDMCQASVIVVIITNNAT